jgi:P pilus assembly chaperone PapD
VRVRVRVRPQTGKPITVTKTVDQTNPGAQAEVNIPLNGKPPTGTSSTVSVEVLRVPGEENVDNNSRDYTVIFTG